MPFVIDGHNDALSRLQRADAGPADFLSGDAATVNLPAAQAGGLAAGLFAVLAPPGNLNVNVTDDGYEVPLSLAGQPRGGSARCGAVGARLFRLVAVSADRVMLVRSAPELDRCLVGEAFGVVLHMEGAEAIDIDLDALELWYAAGLRSLGPVWSRPNAFGCGVPFRFPASPDVGPGLTPAGLALVRHCAELGIAVDVSHLTPRASPTSPGCSRGR